MNTTMEVGGVQSLYSEMKAERIPRPESEPEPVQHKGFSFISLSDVKDESFIPDYTIYRYLERDTQNLLVGDSQAKKSFILIDQAMSVAAGVDWCGQPVKKGGAVYIFGEGRGGIIRRFRAWMKYHNLVEEDLNNFIFLNGSLFVNEDNGSENAVIDSIHQAAEIKGIDSIRLIGWDTASSLFGTDENSANEVARTLRQIRRISCQCDNASEQIVHHMGHSAKDRPRGSYAWMANVDAWHLVEKVNQFQSKILAYGKMKDADPINHNRIFDMNRQPLGVDDRGNEYDSLVACHIENETPEAVGQKMSSTDKMIEVVKGHSGGIFRSSLLSMWKEMDFGSEESCRITLTRQINKKALKQTSENRVEYPH